MGDPSSPQVQTLEPTIDPTSPQVQTLEPSRDPTLEPGLECASAIAMECGEVLSGSTVGTCDNTQRFVLTATTNLKTISACGSGYDTMLALYDSNDALIASQDDSRSNHCGRLNSLLKSVQLTIGTEYTVVLSGFASAVGDYNMELICEAPQVETLEPTIDPTSPQVETLDPTMDPTSPQVDCASSIAIGCGEVLSGSTVGTCDNTQRFVFTA